VDAFKVERYPALPSETADGPGKTGRWEGRKEEQENSTQVGKEMSLQGWFLRRGVLGLLSENTAPYREQFRSGGGRYLLFFFVGS